VRIVNKRSEFILFGLLIAFVFPLEIAGGLIAYHTLGDVFQSLYFMFMVILNIPFLVIAFRSRTIAALGIVALALALVPYQFYLGYRLVRMQEETARIVAYVYEHKRDEREFPADLSGYQFTDPALAAYVLEYLVIYDGAEFVVTYWVGTEHVSHWYSSKTGWGYYPD
jgi:hypothetical protein